MLTFSFGASVRPMMFFIKSAVLLVVRGAATTGAAGEGFCADAGVLGGDGVAATGYRSISMMAFAGNKEASIPSACRNGDGRTGVPTPNLALR